MIAIASKETLCDAYLAQVFPQIITIEAIIKVTGQNKMTSRAKVGAILLVFLIESHASAENYYELSSDPVCGAGSVEVSRIEKRIPEELLPKNTRDQGDTPSCIPHAVIDAMGIALKSKGIPNEIDEWNALQSYESCRNDKSSQKYEAVTGAFALFLREHPEAFSHHSGKTVAQQYVCTLSSAQSGVIEELIFPSKNGRSVKQLFSSSLVQSQLAIYNQGSNVI